MNRTPCARELVEPFKAWVACARTDTGYERLCDHWHETPELALKCARRLVTQGKPGKPIAA